MDCFATLARTIAIVSLWLEGFIMAIDNIGKMIILIE